MKKRDAVKEAESCAKEAYQVWLDAEAQAGEAFSEGKPTSTHEQAMAEFNRVVNAMQR